MFQQIIAILIIIFFFFRLFLQKKNKQISVNEFSFWFIFWSLSLIAVLFIKQIDSFVASLGFSGSGIEILFYLAVIILIYLVFRLRLRQEKIEKNITKIVREMSINNNKKNDR